MPPYILLSSLLGAIYGALFHLWQGKQLRDLLIYLLTGVIGFMVGQTLGNSIGSNIVPIGPIHLIEATVVSWVSLLFVHWLRI